MQFLMPNGTNPKRERYTCTDILLSSAALKISLPIAAALVPNRSLPKKWKLQKRKTKPMFPAASPFGLMIRADRYALVSHIAVGF